MTTTPFSAFLSSIAERGFSILGLSKSDRELAKPDDIIELCHMLLGARGEASGIALSCEILNLYQLLDSAQKVEFFQAVGREFSANHETVGEAVEAYLRDSSTNNLARLSDAARPACSELITRLNQAADATRYLVEMRADLLRLLPDNPDLGMIDREFAAHFISWFNRGFLELRNIDWNTPAAILEKIIGYEAVHGMAGWEDLRERIDPEDRMIYGFFHPRLGDEPLIFVEIALVENMPSTIASVLDRDRPAPGNLPKTAVFYSISNCQDGLRGIPLGNFLIKQVVEDLRNRFPSLKEFVTLSPIPSLRQAIMRSAMGETTIKFDEATFAAASEADEYGWWDDDSTSVKLEAELVQAAQWFLFCGKNEEGRPIDPVARFHLGNGARLERINWCADLSERGLRNSFGMMANYRYQLNEIERNHERFANNGAIAAASSIVRAARSYENRAKRAMTGSAALKDDSEVAEAETTSA